LVEKNSGVGGTWHENRYPGARVDSPSRSYTHIYGVDFGYPNAFCPWTENEKYFNWVADTFELRSDIMFDTEVRSMVWDDASSMWQIHTDGPDGERTLRSNAVITSVGFLNRPNMPDIEGMSSFEGPSWHTSRWPQNIDLSDKRIAVIGTGCTGYQLVPELALLASEITVFQRTPQWLFNVPGYRSLLPDQVTWLDRNLPFHTNFQRFFLTWAIGSFATLSEIDRDFVDEHTLSAANKQLRESCIAFLESKLGDDPGLVEKMIPNHPPFSARPVIVDPEYSVLDAILRENVTLVTDGIRRVNGGGIEDANGVQHDVDVIVYATGFHATEYLFPMSIVGKGGQTVEQLWADGGSRAYNFSMLPGFPNLWSIYGPNTNGALNVAGFHELVGRYALQCIEELILTDKKSVEVNADAYRRFGAVVDERNNNKIWSDPRGHNYYWTKYGRSATQCPFTGPEVYHYLKHPDFADMTIR
jgi:4-hydroxyacetophenone monooxygenase